MRPGNLYVRKTIHKNFGGQWRKGICTPKELPYIFIFTTGKSIF